MNNIETSESAEPKTRQRNEPNANFAIVLRLPVAKMPEVVDLIRAVPGVRIIFQEASVGKLRIVGEREPEELQ